ncbi:hypothetical protein [Deminuibacter soli]|uniref:Transporter n=1 Tax=Deminuibacter soli TaxID=2291815 RepID=A0A3E1NH81_9BACT|nr:hypothetical protein [Deminuibacter soli]RFM27303.1 hypothetical protein DXN05_14845 [Deminuibacter soli]
MQKYYLLVLFIVSCLPAFAQEDTSTFAKKKPVSAAELAKKLSNPVANLISAPLQNNTDYGIGPYRGSKNTLNFQPVIPVSLSKNLNLINRVILPIVTQNNITAPGAKQSGLSDLTASFFVSPVHSKIIWGVGPALLLPTGTNEYLSTKKWGIGPTALIVKQTGGLTFGFLANQIWSVAGNKDRAAVNQLFLQPFLVHNWKTGAGLGINAEITQNWQASNTTVFLNPLATGVTKMGKQTVQFGVGPRIPLAGPDNIKPDFGWRAVLTLVFPQ